jgi:hypothetical protein
VVNNRDKQGWKEMRLPEWDMSRAQWDDYCRFHRELPNGFIQFDTGELICTRHFSNNPEDRKFYSDLNVTVVSTDDTHCPRFVWNDEPVKKTWLDKKGQQILLIDHDNGHVVALSGKGGGLDLSMPRPWALSVPESLRQRACAYWHGPHSPPVGSPVIVNKTRRLTPHEREHIEAIRSECKGWDVMSEQPRREGHWEKRNHWIKGDDVRPALEFDRVMAVKSYLDLTQDERLDASRHGVSNGTIRHEVPFLMLANWEKTTNEDN